MAWVIRPSQPQGSGKSQGSEGGGLGVRREPPFQIWLRPWCQAGGTSGSPGARGNIWTQQADWAGSSEEASHRGRAGFTNFFQSPRLTFQAIVNLGNQLEVHPVHRLQGSGRGLQD